MTLALVINIILCIMSFKQLPPFGPAHRAYMGLEIMSSICTVLVNLVVTPLIIARLW